MVHAIAECHRVDEVKEVHDQALALEIYARQARNVEAERRACDVRLRAERRAGELLKELARDQTSGLKRGDERPSSNDGTTGKSEYAANLERTGISRQTAGRYQALADIPNDEFEAALHDPETKPTTRYFVEHNKKPKRHAKKPEPT